MKRLIVFVFLVQESIAETIDLNIFFVSIILATNNFKATKKPNDNNQRWSQVISLHICVSLYKIKIDKTTGRTAFDKRRIRATASITTITIWNIVFDYFFWLKTHGNKKTPCRRGYNTNMSVYFLLFLSLFSDIRIQTVWTWKSINQIHPLE